jgi:flagellin
MSIIAGSNYAGINTVRNISLIQRSISRTAQHLTSGQETEQTFDEPAAWELSEQMRSQIGSLTQHIKNLEFNLNKNSAVASAISGLHEKLTGIRDAALEAANVNVVTPESGKAFQAQMNNLVEAYNQQLTSAEYDGQSIFENSSGPAGRISPLPELAVAYPEDANAAVYMIDNELASLKLAADATETQSKKDYRSTVRSLEVASQNMAAAESQIYDADSAENQADFLKIQMRLQADEAASSLGSLSSETVFKLMHA